MKNLNMTMSNLKFDNKIVDWITIFVLPIIHKEYSTQQYNA